jgi:hypothetical protein
VEISVLKVPKMVEISAPKVPKTVEISVPKVPKGWEFHKNAEKFFSNGE